MTTRLCRAIASSLLALTLGLALAPAGLARESTGGPKTQGSDAKPSVVEAPKAARATAGPKATKHGQGARGAKSTKSGGSGKSDDRGKGASKADTGSQKPRGGPSSRSGSTAKKPPQGNGSPGKRGPRPAVGVARDDEGRIARSARQKADFRQSQPCPSTGKTSGACPGYVVDHRVPLKRGGADAPHNMQWQSQQAARDKDRRE